MSKKVRANLERLQGKMLHYKRFLRRGGSLGWVSGDETDGKLKAYFEGRADATATWLDFLRVAVGRRSTWDTNRVLQRNRLKSRAR